jgi:hypothetical protein
VTEEVIPSSPAVYPLSGRRCKGANIFPLSCNIPFDLTASPVKINHRKSVFTEEAKAALKCIPYEPGPTSKIIIRPHFRTARFYGWLRAFAFPPGSAEAWNKQKNKDKLREASMTITPSMFCDSRNDAGDYCMRYLFYGCRNLKLGSVFHFTEDWDAVTRAGHDFMVKAFYGCEALDQFPADYKEPQALKTVGNNFKAYKCFGCRNLENIGLSNTEPPLLTAAGYGFESFEYGICEKLLLLPEMYTEPKQLISDTLYDFQFGKFKGCTRLRTLPDNYRETEIVTAGDNYLAYKFAESGLEFLPGGYTESLALTFVKNNCHTGKFAGCTHLAALPVNYIEINPVSSGTNFLKWKFRDCPFA